MRSLSVLLAAALIASGCEESRPPTNDVPIASDIVPADAPSDASAPTDAVAVDVGPALTNPFATGPYGTAVRDLADDFTVPTQDGDWSFRARWTGEDSHVFLLYAPRAIVYPNGQDYSAGLFRGSILDLIDRSPRNTHYFFGWLSDEPGFQSVRDRWLGEIDTLSEKDRAWWRAHVHFITPRVRDLPNWIGRMISSRAVNMLPYKRYDPLQFAIDRRQRIREVGMLGRLVQNGIVTELPLLANEPTYYEWEWARDEAQRRSTATVVSLARAQVAHDTIDTDVDLPDATMMSTFDTLEVDLSMECPNHRDGECGAWDYLSYLWVCDPRAPDPDAGASPDAGDAGPQWTCNREIARWITTYWREGRWVTDISGMLPFLRRGGRTHFRWNASGQFDPRRTDYTVTLSLRFANRNRGMRPVDAVPLWTGGDWNAMYDSRHPPQRVMIPADVRKVELYTLTTGHGGVQPTNCAEFCDHQHHFTVNGAEHVQSFPEARSMDGCAARVDAGVVPNQHGTWYFGRGGWCPGLDVAPWIVDVTGEVRRGMENELRYTTTYGNRPVSAGLGNIVLSSYLVFWR